MHNILATAVAVLALTTVAAQAGDPVNGAKVFNKCKSCHMVGPDAKKRVGPPLNGVVGQAFAGSDGFNYSPAIREMAAGGKIWDEATLDAYLKKPKDIVPKGRMAFPGLPDAGQRADVIAYLEQFAADGSMAK